MMRVVRSDRTELALHRSDRPPSSLGDAEQPDFVASGSRDDLDDIFGQSVVTHQPELIAAGFVAIAGCAVE